jgi:hypothetical protein
LQDNSQVLRARATALRQRSTALLARGRSTSEHTEPCVPSPAQRHDAERRMLDMFRDDGRRAAQS